MASDGSELIVIRCDCGVRLKAPARAEGRRVRCPRCAAVFLAARDARERDPVAASDALDEEGYYRVAPAGPAPPKERPPVAARADPGPALQCPSCQKLLGAGSKICVACGIELKTGRAIRTAQEDRLDEIYTAAEAAIRAISWVIGVGFYPIASEAFGVATPWVARGIAIFTIATSVTFWGFGWSGHEDMVKRLPLWSGRAYSDGEIDRLVDSQFRGAEGPRGPAAAALSAELKAARDSAGAFDATQLVTHALLHGGLLHLATNMLFLMVLGARVNALVGNVMMAPLYVGCAIIAGLVHHVVSADDPIHPMMGASGAVMGMAGMYLVLFPVHNVHMAAWWRWGLGYGFHLSLKLWTVRGFWVVLFYLAFDIASVALGLRDQTAHWAHLGGFAAGMAAATLLLVTRLLNARGGDVFSVVLGRHAWRIIGRPRAGAERA